MLESLSPSFPDLLSHPLLKAKYITITPHRAPGKIFFTLAY